MDKKQIETSTSLLGKNTVEMLLQTHKDSLWMLENLGVGCEQPDIMEAFRVYEEDGRAIVYDGRVYITESLVSELIDRAPGIDEFFVPRNSFLIGGTAPYLYDDEKKQGGKMPTAEDVATIARIAEKSGVVAGMGRGVKLKDEVEQINLMAENCTKPMYFAATNDKAIARAKELHAVRKNLMVVFCLTRPPLQVNENFSQAFVDVVKNDLPVFISAMPLAGISAPYSYNGVLSMTHAEVLFGICAAQLINPGSTVIHAGFPTVADPKHEYNPDYGLKSHQLLNILMAHLNMMLDLPSIQSGGTTNEEHPTERAFEDARNGQALALKYGFHMIRHPFAFLKQLVDFSIYKLEKAIEIAENVKPEDAPEVDMPEYDERGFQSIQERQLRMYMDDPLTTSNMSKIFMY
ncbi:MAG: trimethylamine methyltransferase family protein [Thermodesulfobacteriota bacterium]